MGKIRELNPLCVLDFYVYEGCQRSGHGRSIFEKMLEWEGVEASQLGYDRPSDKLISFLRKHYNLREYIPQNNNFIVYNDYYLQKNNKGRQKGNIYEDNNGTFTNSNKSGHNTILNNRTPVKKTFHQLRKEPEAFTGNYCATPSNENNKFNKKSKDGDGDDETNIISNQYQYQDQSKPNKNNIHYSSSSSDYGAFSNFNPNPNPKTFTKFKKI